MPSITAEKQAYEERLNSYITKYRTVMFCKMDNVRSQQIHDVRRDLRGKAEMVMGKKTLQAKIIKNRAEGDSATESDKAFYKKCDQLGLLTMNTSLIFTNSPMSEISVILDRHRIQAPARVGAIAPCDVIIPAGNTGMEPTATSFFQALNIPTKIAKGTVEIVSDKKVLSEGSKVDNSTATLLQKLKISPFYYQVEVQNVYEGGVVFERKDLSITDEMIEGYITQGIATMNALAMGAGVPTAASFPAMLVDAFKTLLGASIATEYSFSEFNGEKLRQDALDGKLGGGAAAPAGGSAASGSAAASSGQAKAEEPAAAEEEEDDFIGGLF
jgi:large subunit ribosomal protein LP0